MEGCEQHMITNLHTNSCATSMFGTHLYVCINKFIYIHIHVYLAFYWLICCLLPHEWLRQNLVALQDLESLRAEMLVTRSLGWCEVEHPKCT